MGSPSPNPVWVCFPRWLQESGIPQHLQDECHPFAWPVFRKLIELDCEQNLMPDEFFIRLERLSRWIGLGSETIAEVVELLQEQNRIEWRPVDAEDAFCKITVPIHVPLSEAEIRSRLEDAGLQSNRIVLRYFHDLGDLNRPQKVVYLYQMLYGLKFTPRIVEDLEEIAATYDMAVIYQTFSEAYARKSKSFGWIKSQLQKKSIGSEA